jgi:predicted Zn-dependent protease
VRTLLLSLTCVVALAAQTNPAAMAEQGKQAMAEGRFAEAARVYAGLVQQIPDNPGLRLNLGMALHMSGKDDEAIPHFEKALAVQPDIFPALLFLGASHMRQGRPAKAIDPLEKAAKLAPKELQALQMLGEAYAQLGRPRDALKHQLEIAKLAPQEPMAWAALLQTYDALAADAFGALEKAAPESAWMVRLLADLRASQQQYPSALYLYNQALERDPSMRGLHAGLAVVYRKSGKAEWAAVEEQREAEQPKPDCADAKLECAVAKGELRTVAVAKTTTPEEHFWRAKAASRLASETFAKLEGLPDSARKHELLAQILAEQERPAESAAAWRKALALEPRNPLYAEELTAQLYLARELDEALPRLETLAKQQPQEPRWSFFLGDVYLQQQKLEQAVPLLERARKLAPRELSIRHALGRAYMQLGEPEKALPELEAALPIDADGSLHYQLAQAYIQTGRRDEAKAPLAKYQELQQAHRAQLEAAQDMEITAPAP